MSDTKLRPEDLTSEERSIVDQYALKLYAEQPGNGGDAEAAYADGLRLIRARRALFAPAPSEAAKVETHICEFCSKELEEEAIRYGQATLPTPAPPEPAAPVSDAVQRRILNEPDVVIGAVGGAVKPAAPEMPRKLCYADVAPVSAEQATAAAKRLIDAAFGNKGEKPRFSIPVDLTRDDDILLMAFIEQRTHAQPVAVGMTEELEELLRWARDAAGNVGSLGYPSAQEDEKRIRMMIDKVRQQAAQPVAYEMPEDLRRWAWRAVEMLRVGQANAEDKDGKDGGRLFMEAADELAAAIRNHPRLQAHEGKGEGGG